MTETSNCEWLIYIVRCSDNSLYTGITTDIKRRLDQHNKGKGAAYTRSRRPVKLIYQEAFEDRSSVSRREAEIKKLTRKEKELLVKGL